MNTIADLRKHLFATLEGLQDKDKPMDIDRAKAVSEVAQVIINSAKVEVDHMKVAGGNGSGFLQSAPVAQKPVAIGQTFTEQTGSGTKTVTQLGNGATVTRHKAS